MGAISGWRCQMWHLWMCLIRVKLYDTYECVVCESHPLPHTELVSCYNFLAQEAERHAIHLNNINIGLCALHRRRTRPQCNRIHLLTCQHSTNNTIWHSVCRDCAVVFGCSTRRSFRRSAIGIDAFACCKVHGFMPYSVQTHIESKHDFHTQHTNSNYQEIHTKKI